MKYEKWIGKGNAIERIVLTKEEEKAFRIVSNILCEVSENSKSYGGECANSAFYALDNFINIDEENFRIGHYERWNDIVLTFESLKC